MIDWIVIGLLMAVVVVMAILGRRWRTKSPLRELCLGCHEVRLSTDMGFEGSTYRCKWCLNPTLDKPEAEPVKQKQHAGAGSTSIQSGGSVSISNVVGGTNYSTEVPGVDAGRTLQITGTNANIRVNGDVRERAQVLVTGTNCRVKVLGRIHAGAIVRAVGTNARVEYASADPDADVSAEGTNAKVKVGW